jgi:hypothetical protein
MTTINDAAAPEELAARDTTIEQLRLAHEADTARIADLIREKTEIEVQLADRLAAMQASLNRVDCEWQAKWDALWEALGAEADRRDWCGEYDDFAERHGGPSRDATVEWWATVQATVDVERFLGNLSELNLLDTSVRIQFQVSDSTEGRRAQCVCYSGRVLDEAQAVLDNEELNYRDLTVIRQGCDNCG